jgi:homoserine kinase
VVATNELLGRPAPMSMLLECAMAGEQAGCGAVHPDKSHRRYMGGFILAERAAARHRPFAGA